MGAGIREVQIELRGQVFSHIQRIADADKILLLVGIWNDTVGQNMGVGQPRLVVIAAF